MHDLVIKGAVLVDGMGNPAADGEVAVSGGKIAALGENVGEVTARHFDEMRDRIMMGTLRTMAIHDEERHRLAIHEAGHTAVAYYLPHTDPIHKVTIIPRGRSLGSTHQLPELERHTLPEQYLRARRLNGVRKILRSHGPGEVRIYEVANEWGFWHMGQFAADYRKLFGERPSETLERV